MSTDETTTTPETTDIDTSQQPDPQVTPTETNMDDSQQTITSTMVEPVDAQPEQLEQPEQESEQQGPLSKLTDKAVKSTLMRKVSENVPSSAKPYIQKGAEPATKAIAAVDKTLQTDEAQRVAHTAVDLFNAMTAFTILILAWTVSHLEKTLQIDNQTELSTTSPDEQEGTEQERQIKTDDEQSPKSELIRHKDEAIHLFKRYKTVAYAVISKASACAQEKKKPRSMNTQEQQEQQEQPNSTYDPHSIDKVVKNHAKKGAKLAKQVGAYSLSQASQFEGPGSGTIAPAADYIISKLPEDAKRAVQESTSPF